MTSLWLASAELRRDRGRTALLVASVAVGAATAALVLTLQGGVQRALQAFFPAGDRTIEVRPPQLALAGLAARLDPGAVDRLAALPEVEREVPKMLLRVPALSSYRGNFFGQPLALTVEIAAEGLPPSALGADALLGSDRFVYRPGSPLPACIHPELLALYNLSFAPTRGLPHLDARLLNGFELPVTVGSSMLGASAGTPEPLSVRLICVSPLALLGGLTVPLAAVQALNRKHGAEAQSFSSALVIARSASAVPALVTALEAQGFEADQGASALARRLGVATRFGGTVLLGLALALLALAGTLVAQAFGWSIRARAGELRLLKALGATGGFLARQLLLEAVIIGALGGFAGVCTAWGVSGWWLGPRLQALLAAAAVPAADLRWASVAPAAWAVAFGLALSTALAGALVALRAVGSAAEFRG